MNVFVATKETQGQRKNDFCHANEGEIVRFQFECDGETVDGKCGCKRSMSGVETHKATTTIKVAEINITREEFFERIKQSLQKSGWLASMKEDEADKFVKQDVDELLKIANHFDVGSVVEKRGNKFRQREKMSKKTDDVFYCLDCDKKIKKGGEAIQVRTGYISEGSFDAEEDVAYYHVVCFNQLTGRNFPPAKLGKNLEKIEGLK